jgi:hypothetical protein
MPTANDLPEVLETTEPERLATGFIFTEGALYFTDEHSALWPASAGNGAGRWHRYPHTHSSVKTRFTRHETRKEW